MAGVEEELDFAALEELDFELACRSTVHDITHKEDGPAVWLVSWNCVGCGASEDMALRCDEAVQGVVAAGQFCCAKCFGVNRFLDPDVHYVYVRI